LAEGKFPNSVRRCRESLPNKPTMSDVARRIGRTKTALSAVELGKVQLSPDWIRLLTAALNCTEADLRAVTHHAIAGFAEEAAPFTPEPGTRLASIVLSDTEFFYTLRGNHLDELGLRDGAVLIVDISPQAHEKLRTGDVVIAQVYGGASGAKTVARQFIEPDLLISNSRKHNLPSLNRSMQDVAIKGVVTSSHREAISR
jgi:transcriptional regulator with XRE-family HTH domain